MKKKITSLLAIVFLTITPVVALAQTTTVTINSGSSGVSCTNLDINSLQTLFGLFTCILIKSLWPLLITLAVIVFIIGVVKYIAGADDSAKRTEGRNFMVYGLLALFVMVSVWGLVGILQGTFGIGNSPVIPQLQDQ